MARVSGPKLDDLRVVSERFEKIVIDHLRDTLTLASRHVTSAHSAADDVARVGTLWTKIVDGILLSELEQAFWFGVNVVHGQLARRLAALTAAVNPDDVLGDEDPPSPDVPASFPPAAASVPRVSSPAAEARLATRRNMLVGIGDHAWEVARNDLLEGMQAGEGVAALRDRVIASLDVSAARAQLVARTEVNQAANAGSLDEMRASGVPALKEWIATSDARTRPDHLEADGQKVALDEPFLVGGVAVNGPEDEINCRCTIGYDVSDEDIAALGSSDALTAAADAAQSKAMIALIPCDADLDRLALEGGESRDLLHLTLVFLGDAVDYTPDLRAALLDALAAQLASVNAAQVTARIFGAALWNAGSDEPAWVLNVGDAEHDITGFSLRQMLNMVAMEAVATCDCPLPEQHTPWSPHICVAYSDDPAYLEKATALQGDVMFDRVRVAFADEVTDIQLEATDATLPQNGAGGDMGGKPNPGTTKDKRLKQNKPTQKAGTDVTAATEDEVLADQAPADAPASATSWRGCLVVEGVATGDGREFAPDSISWPDPTTTIIPLRWNKEDSHGGEKRTLTVNVGRVDVLWRDGDRVMGSGTFNVATEDGLTAWGMVNDGYLGGVSIDADDIAEADVEYVWPEGGDDEGSSEEDEMIMILFGAPEKVIFHAGRIRGVTLCDIPAFVEAAIELVDPEVAAAQVASAVVQMGAVGTHSTATSDGSWDGPASEKNLPTPVPEATAAAAYAWLDSAAVDADALPKSACRFIHHEVAADGEVGAANLTACSTGIGVLHGGRGGTTIPGSDRRGTYNHLAGHLRDGGQEPPPFVADGEEAALLAHASSSEWRPPRNWFTDPKFTVASPIVVTADGRVYGHAAEWGMCHIGYPSECVTAPWEDDHPYFMTGSVICDNGERLAVGQITCGIGHAPLAWSASRAADHYDNTEYAVSDLVVGNDKHGIWVAGAIRPWATERQVHELRASGQVSPDWRSIGGNLRMVGLLTVTASGYQTRRARALVSDGHLHSLISNGFISTRREPGVTTDDLDRRALRLMRDQLAARVGITRS